MTMGGRGEDGGYSSCSIPKPSESTSLSPLSTRLYRPLFLSFLLFSVFLLLFFLFLANSLPCFLALTPPSLSLFLYHCLAHFASARKQFGADYSPATPTRPYTQTFTLALMYTCTHSHKHRRTRLRTNAHKYTLRLCVASPPTMPLHHPFPAALKHDLVWNILSSPNVVRHMAKWPCQPVKNKHTHYQNEVETATDHYG